MKNRNERKNLLPDKNIRNLFNRITKNTGINDSGYSIERKQITDGDKGAKVLDLTGQKSDSGNFYKRFESSRAVGINLLQPSEEKGPYFQASTDYSQGSNKKRQKLGAQEQIFNKNSKVSVSSPGRLMLPKKFPGNMTMPQIRPVLPFVSVCGMYAEPPRAKAESMVSQGLKMAPSK
jgi:hypothetical protein